VITHVEDDSNMLWIVRKENIQNEVEQIREIMQNTTLKPMESEPEINESFIVSCEGVLLRATREKPSIDQDAAVFQFYLQDTGEYLHLSRDDVSKVDLFSMPKKIKDIAPLAQKCQWSGNESDAVQGHDHDKQSFLTSCIYKTFTIEVLKTEPEAVINIWPFDNSLESFLSKGEVEEEKEGPPWNEEEIDKTNESGLDSDDDSFCEGIRDNYKIEIGGGMTLTKKEYDILFEEPVTTNNACIAVQGYETRDDAEICKFFDSKTGACFKGATCRKIHLPPLTDGFETRDKREIHYRGPSELPLPAFFKCYDIMITHFNTLNKFMCVYVENFSKAMELGDILNAEEQVNNYQKLTSAPSLLQLVILEDNGKFLRAKILQTCDNNQKYSLLLLDTGVPKEASIDKLYEWNTRLNHCEILAVEMTVANIAPIKGKVREAVEKIFSIQRQKNSYFKAFIT
jgi:hypothetical protein